jgi:two-component system nitrogen regulation sensor histidine kinase NtrY
MARIPLRNNARLVLASALGALALFLAMDALLRTSRDFAPDFLASVLLYALTVLNLALLLVLVLILGRNLARVLMERRRGVLGARFRLRLALVFLSMAVLPSLLLVIVGSDLIRQTIDRWFNVDVERLLSSSQALGVALRQAQGDRSRVGAQVLARELETRRLLEPGGPTGLRRTVERRARALRLDRVDVFAPQGELLAVLDPRLPGAGAAGGAGEALAETALQSGRDVEAAAPFAGGELAQVAVPVRGADGRPVGAVVVSSFTPAELLAESQEIQRRYTKFRQTQAFKEPIKAVYLSIYGLAALLILFGAVWLSMYLARRITVPLRLVSEGAERIASGERGVRVEFPAGNDEFAALIGSFNRMSERLKHSEEEIELSRQGLARKNRQLEERQHLIETVVESVGTGIVVVSGDGRLRAVNAAAFRLLDLPDEAVGQDAEQALPGDERAPVLAMLRRQLAPREGQAPAGRQQRDLLLTLGGRDRHLSVTVAPLQAGALVVLDDLTSLMRAQKVAAWGEVARKLAHEIKNPLTPIQLSAQRVRKAYVRAAPDFERVLGECTEAIVREVEALKNLVDEFAQFARLPAASLAPASLHEVVEQTLSLYEGLFADVVFERRFDPGLPRVRLDVDQFKRVLINLIDNAIEAMDRRGRVVLQTEHEAAAGRVRLRVADDGPGIAPEDRERLFVPHFSTKKRGSGLGLSIVARIVQEHHGSLRVEDQQPRGASFVIELPA